MGAGRRELIVSTHIGDVDRCDAFVALVWNQAFELTAPESLKRFEECRDFMLSTPAHSRFRSPPSAIGAHKNGKWRVHQAFMRVPEPYRSKPEFANIGFSAREWDIGRAMYRGKEVHSKSIAVDITPKGAFSVLSSVKA